MSRTLGEAIIAILPDTGAFKKLLQAKLKEAMAGVSADVTINPNVAKLDAALASSKAKVADLQAQLDKTKLGADSAGLDKAVAKATAEVADLQSKTGSLKMDADDKALTAKITDLEAKSQHLQDGLKNMKSDVDIRAALAKIQSYDAQIKVLKSDAANIALKASDDSLKKALDDSMARLAVLKGDAQKIALGANADKLNATIKLEEAKIVELTRKRDLDIKVKLDDTEALAKAGFLDTVLHGGGSASGAGKNGIGGVAGEVLQTALPGGGATTLPGVAGLGGIALGVLSTGFAGIVPLITAATGAIGAFGILAIPTIKGVVNGLTALSTATGTYGNASKALNAGIQSSPQNLKAYQASLAVLSPQLAGAAELLTSQGTTWANLTPKQRASEEALKNNTAAYKALLPAQKNALNALLQEGVAYNNMTPAQRAAATGIQGLEKEFSKLSNILAPITLKVLNAGLAVLNTLLPDLLPFAKVAGDAIIKLLNSFEAFSKSAGFKAFQANMLKLAGPAILAIGDGFGKVAIALGKLLVAMESPDGLVILTGLFRILADVIEGIAIAFKIMTPVMVNAFRIFNDLGKSGLDTIIGLFKVFGDVIQGHWKSAWDALTTIVKDWIHNIGDALKSVQKLWDTLVPVKIRTEIANIFDGIRHDTAHTWDLIYNDTIGDVLRISHNVETQFDSLQHAVANIFDGIRHDTAISWNDLYGATVGVAIRIGHDVETDFNNMKTGVAVIFGAIGNFFAGWWGSTKTFFTNSVHAIDSALTTAWDSVKNTTMSVWNSIGNFFASWWGSTKNFMTTTVHAIGSALQSAWNSVKSTTADVWNAIGSFFATWWGSTKNFMTTTAHAIGSVLASAWNTVKNNIATVFGNIGDFFAHWWGSTKNFIAGTAVDIGNGLRSAWNSIKNDVSRLWGDIGSFFAHWWGDTESFMANAAGNTIRNGLASAWKNIGNDAKILWKDIGGFMSSGVHAGIGGLVSVVNGVINDILNPLITGYNAVNNIWSGADISKLPDIKGFASGGKIRGGTTDTADDVLIRVSKNETVLSAAHSKILSPALAALGVPGYAGGGAILDDAVKYQGHKYVWGGPSNPTSGWDCSSFVGYVLGHDFGYPLPGGVKWNPNEHGPVAAQYTREPGFSPAGHNINDIQAGDLLVENSGGHVGFGVGPNRMFSAYNQASGTIFSNADNMTNIFRSGAGGGVYAGPGGAISAAQAKAYNAYIALLNKDIKLYSPAAITRAFEKNPAPLPTGVLTGKGLDQYKAMGGNVAARTLPAVQQKYQAAIAAIEASMGEFGGDPPAGVGGTAGEIANGKQIYEYLLTNLFGGNKIAAAGAIASIWGESTWNPFAVGTGGRGLIGWSPASTISDADFKGGMRTQLPDILRFVTNSGDSGVISDMFRATSVLQAANEWGTGVERFGINDVHATGLTLAKQIAGLKAGGQVGAMVGKYDSGGWLPVGASVAVNNTGSPERVSVGGLSTDARAIIKALNANTAAVHQQGAQVGRAINGGMARGASRGYYGS